MRFMKRNKKLPKPAMQNTGSKTCPPGFWEDIHKGMDYIDAGQYEEAEKILTRKAEKEKDDNYTIVCLLADSLFFQNKLDEAEELYRGCIELDSLVVHPLHGLALVLKRKGLESEAQEHVEKVEQLTKLLGELPKHLPRE